MCHGNIILRILWTPDWEDETGLSTVFTGHIKGWVGKNPTVEKH